MEPLTGVSPENHISPESITITTPLSNHNNNEEYIPTNSNSTSSADLIASSQDLLTEIFLLLPVISLLRFTSASKQWYSLIKSPNFTFLRNPYLDPPSGLFFEGWDARSRYNYVPLQTRNPVNIINPPFTSLGFDSGCIKILQSCNGLLLCGNDFQKYYVYNPTTNRFITLPKHCNYNPDTSCYMTLAFDPANACGYKVVCNYMYKVMKIEIYSSVVGKWKVLDECVDDLVDVFDRGVYGHNAIHWMSFPNRLVYLKLDEEVVRYIDIDTPDTTVYGTILDEFLAESCDGMLLVVRCCRLRRLNVYEIKKDYSEWCIKYHVDLEQVIRVYPNMVTRLGLHFIVQSLVIGEWEREEDSFVVLELPGKLIQYNFMVNTIFQLCDFSKKSHHQGGFFPKTIFQLSDFTPENRRFINGSCFHFIPSLAAV
ncbi:F-box protein At5g07610-like [Bidens hawaiensis]|uniref:F-box protein At5g07610-like n=1 Tax=Bidens hawaiensis TaxID=980011 RepID=UPI0040496DB5